jgi:hypothetical protein
MLVFVKLAQLRSLVLKDQNNMTDITDMIIQLSQTPTPTCRSPVSSSSQSSVGHSQFGVMPRGVTQRDNGTRTPLREEEDGRAGPSTSHS